MRKFIVKRFALDYMCKFFGYGFNFPRAATFLYPIMVMAGLVISLDEDFPKLDYFDIATIVVVIISMLVGFVYLRIKPVKIMELDEEQAFQAGEAISKQIVFYEMGEDEITKIMESNKYIRDNYEPKRFYKPWLVLFHPAVITILSLILTLIYLNEN